MTKAVQSPDDDAPPERLRLARRRALLAAGLTGAAIAGTGAIGIATMPAEEDRPLTEPPGPERDRLRTVERVYSQARGREVDLITLRPTARPTERLPASLLLHGLGGTADLTASTGLAKALYSDTAQGAIRPFAFVAVDGGDNYWHEAHSGDDPLAMLLEEVPVWLRERGLGDDSGLPFACTGYSMGGFGALLYARRRAERRRPLRVAATVAPALMTTWSEMRTREVFESRAEWAAYDPLRHVEALRDVQLGVWCGDQDDFIEGVRVLMRRAKPEHAFIGPGDHLSMFNAEVDADVVRFVGRRA